MAEPDQHHVSLRAAIDELRALGERVAEGIERLPLDAGTRDVAAGQIRLRVEEIISKLLSDEAEAAGVKLHTPLPDDADDTAARIGNRTCGMPARTRHEQGEFNAELQDRLERGEAAIAEARENISRRKGADQ